MSQQEIITKVRNTIKSDPNAEYIKSIYLFGSFLHGNAGKKSDVDLLFEMRKTMSLFQIGAVHYRLEQALKRKVDFVSKKSVIHELKDKIIPEAKKIYERKKR